MFVRLYLLSNQTISTFIFMTPWDNLFDIYIWKLFMIIRDFQTVLDLNFISVTWIDVAGNNIFALFHQITLYHLIICNQLLKSHYQTNLVDITLLVFRWAVINLFFLCLSMGNIIWSTLIVNSFTSNVLDYLRWRFEIRWNTLVLYFVYFQDFSIAILLTVLLNSSRIE